MIDTTKKEHKNIDKKSLIFSVNRDERRSIKNTLRDLKLAIDSAQSVNYPNRVNLLDIYNDLLTTDPQIVHSINQRKKRIKGLQWSVISSSNQKEDKKTTELLKGEWFKKFLDFTLDTFFFGNTLLELTSKEGKVDCLLIPRENVIPEFTQIKISPQSNTGDIDYSSNTYKNNLININNNNNPRDLGELLNVSKFGLFKSEMLLNWSQYVEIFAQPLRVATTDTEDVEELEQIMTYLKELGRSGYMVKDSQTQLEFVSSNSQGGSSALYTDFAKYIDEQISKMILGGTMITDSGSSRSQADVHERASYLYTKADISFVVDIINNKLFDVLRYLGFNIPKTSVYQVQEPEIITNTEKLDVDRFLLENFEITDLSYFEKRYGVSLKLKEKVNAI